MHAQMDRQPENMSPPAHGWRHKNVSNYKKLPSIEVRPTALEWHITLTLTFNLPHAMVKTYTHAKVQGQQSVSFKDIVETNGWTNKRIKATALPPLLMWLETSPTGNLIVKLWVIQGVSDSGRSKCENVIEVVNDVQHLQWVSAHLSAVLVNRPQHCTILIHRLNILHTCTTLCCWLSQLL